MFDVVNSSTITVDAQLLERGRLRPLTTSAALRCAA